MSIKNYLQYRVYQLLESDINNELIMLRSPLRDFSTRKEAEKYARMKLITAASRRTTLDLEIQPVYISC
jgi:hypothetical protein